MKTQVITVAGVPAGNSLPVMMEYTQNSYQSMKTKCLKLAYTTFEIFKIKWGMDTRVFFLVNPFQTGYATRILFDNPASHFVNDYNAEIKVLPY